MATVRIRGVGIEVTEAMRDHAKSEVLKLDARTTLVSHEITVRRLPSNQVDITFNLQVAEGSFNATKKVPSTAFYTGLKECVSALQSQIDSAKGQFEARRKKQKAASGKPTSAPAPLEEDVVE